MLESRIELLNEVANYYSNKFTEHGATPRGVDWNGEDSQILRFEQLSKVIEPCEGFSLNDLGCGYGALYDFLSKKFKKFSYTGVDVSEAMIQAARKCHQDTSQAQFIVDSKPPQRACYGIASGIFNVCQGRSKTEWQSYVEETLDVLDRTSLLGFAFNCLTSYSDAEKMRDYLYYADPCSLFDLCKRRYSRNVALLHDYGLYEFTILVRKM